MQRAQMPPQVRLNWQDPVTNEESVILAPLPISIGRMRENTVALNSDAVSRQHALLEYVNGEVVVHDRQSKNGVLVNQQRVKHAPLKDGDTFQIGPFRFSIEISPTDQPYAPSQAPTMALPQEYGTMAAPQEYGTMAAPADFGTMAAPQEPGTVVASVDFGTVMMPPGAAAQPSQPPQIRVRWIDPTTQHKREVVAAPPISIGRQHDNTIPLPVINASRQHAILTLEGGQVILTDQGSGNGTFLNGQRIQRAPVSPTDTIEIGGVCLTAALADAPASRPVQPAAQPAPLVPPSLAASRSPTPPAPTPIKPPAESTLVFSGETGLLLPFVPAATVEETFPPAFFQQPVVPFWQAQQSGIPVTEITYLAIGGGLGSFTWIDHLLISGVPEQHIASIGLEPKPHARYERLCHNSQVLSHERLRSNSDACPDNIWGWPSYGLREIWHSLGRGQIGNALRVSVQVFGEPVLTETYTPRASDVFNSIDREAQRIGWGRIWRYGQAHAIRKTDDGRYIIAYTQINQRLEVVKQFIVARYVHIAVGYPAIQFLADLQDYRDRTKDFQRVVNAYEDHSHIYDHLARAGGVVMVRGRGIVASRVIQRLAEAHLQNPRVGILQVLRSPLLAGHRDGRVRRKVENHTELQPFNWPKACAGGTLRRKLEQADDQQRDRLLNDWGGTTTASRKDWRAISRAGLREGWYRIYFGRVKRVERNQYGQIATLIATSDPRQPESWLPADFIIDCTGLEAALESNALLKDMVDTYRLGRNPKGRLRVANDFEALGMANGPGHVYASGTMTLGGPFAMADSFIGLQYAALRSVEALRKLGAPGLRRLGPLRSFRQWTRWVRSRHP
ncbi:MAG TPA: FHA domain-containing protein [Ktedonobacterales bacterium]|jgi:pSer/pThr/pTyr-binding forkhead associated (FHA) protein